ncbi:sodium/glucose cotransporter 1 isoform X3 [Rhinolophus sinicus]|uniref:sodium/glucose cotransporter 1 isoform X3 n=1 Tax=Rhinolophus sinicus TaxID=89399 RepID=UPI003D79F9CD
MPRGRSQDALRRRWNQSQSQNRNRRRLWEEPVQEQRHDLYRVMNRVITMNWNPVGLPINSAVDILVMVLYVVLVLGVGLWTILSRSRGTVEEFYLAGRNLAWWQIGTSLFASNIGTGHLMGLAGTAVTSGIAVGAFEWNAPFLLCVLGWIFSPIYIKAGVVTMPEYLKKRFGSYRIQFLLALLCLFLYVFNDISLEISTGAMFMRMVLGLDVYLATIVLLTITGIYTITGGFAAVVYTNALHAGTMVLGSALLTGFAFTEVGGYRELLNNYLNAKPSIIREGNWTAKPECYLPRLDSFHIFRNPITADLPWPGIVFGVSIVSLYYWCSNQIFVQRCLAGKNLSHVKGGCVLCGYLKLLPMFVIVMPGMISRILYPEKVACVVPSECEKHCGIRAGCSPMAYPVLVVELLPSGIQGLMLSALLASLMSSLTSVFNSASALFTMDIYTQMRPMATEKELMVTGRFFVIILIVVTIFWVPIIETTHSEQLFITMEAVLSSLVPPIAAIFLLAMFCSRVTEQGAFWGLAGGLLIGFLRMVSMTVYGPQSCSANNKCPPIICDVPFLYFAIFLFIVSLLTMLGISVLTDPIPDEHLLGFCWSLRKEERVDLDAKVQGKRSIPTFHAEPDVFKESQSCLQEVCSVFCGLEPRPGAKLAPEKANMEEMEHGATPEGTEHSDMAESPCWRNIVNTCGFLLILTTVLCHVYYY